MLQDLTSNPLTYAAGCLIWLPLAIWVISLVHWTVLGEIDVVTAILGIVTAVGLGALAMSPPHPMVAPLIFVFVVLTVFLYPVVRHALHQRELKSIDYESIERAYELLAEKQDNVGARLRLARALYATGRPGHAVAIAKDTLAKVPENLFQDEHRMVRQWQALVRNPAAFEPVGCGHCGALNDPGQVYCRSCGREVFLGGRVSLGAKLTARRWIAAWFAALAAIVGIPSAATALPPVAALLAIVVLVAIGAGAIAWAFRKEAALV